MTEPRIEKLISLHGKKFRRQDVAEAITEYFGDDYVDSAAYIRAGRVIREAKEKGIIIHIGAARFEFTKNGVTNDQPNPQ